MSCITPAPLPPRSHLEVKALHDKFLKSCVSFYFFNKFIVAFADLALVISWTESPEIITPVF
jgi:hypothetical protein